MDILNSLNDEQRQAVLTTTGPLLILAGAGSGKTKTLTHRIAYLLAQGHATQDTVLAVTFTNKAAREMRERLSALLDRNAVTSMSVGTFHSLGAKILREQNRHTTRTAGFTILDSNDSERLMRRTFELLNVNPKEFSPKSVRHIISASKNALTSPEELAQNASSPIQEVAARAFPVYERLLKEENAFDFDDLLIKPLQLLTQHPQLKKLYQQRWHHVLVDEYQDTNPPQDRLIKLLAAPHNNVCVVGDDYQAIYSWRGAHVDHILQFEKGFPGAAVVYLTRNYRSTAPIITAANHLIKNNRHQKHKELWTTAEEGTPVSLVSCNNEQDEARLVTSQLRTITDEGGSLSDCAVLYRTNAQSRAFEEACLAAGIPYQIIGGLKFYDRAEVKDALALLTMLQNPHARLAFERVVKTLVKGVGAKSVEQLAQQAVQRQISFAEIIQDSSLLSPRQYAAFAPLRTALADPATPPQTAADHLEHMLSHSGYLAYLKNLPDAKERQENIDELISVAAGYNSITTFLEATALISDIDAAADKNETVTLMTLHAAKGLEFDTVWLVGLEEGLLPHKNSLEKQQDIEEERRLLYVGITRARQQITLTHVSSRLTHGQRTPQLPSRFIRELPDSVVATRYGLHEIATNNPIISDHDRFLHQQPPSTEATYISVEVGDTVTHAHFGRGVVIGIDGSLVTAVFEGHGMKSITSESIAPSIPL